MIVELNNDNFDEIISKRLVLVEFYAPWCSFCVRQNVMLEDMKEITVYKLNGDIYPEIVNKFGVNSYPSFIIFDKGKAVGKFSGLHTKYELMSILTQYMKK